MLFRFGVVVMFNVLEMAEAAFLKQLLPFVQEPFDSPIVEPLDIQVTPNA